MRSKRRRELKEAYSFLFGLLPQKIRLQRISSSLGEGAFWIAQPPPQKLSPRAGDSSRARPVDDEARGESGGIGSVASGSEARRPYSNQRSWTRTNVSGRKGCGSEVAFAVFYCSPSVTAYAVPAPPLAVEPFGLCNRRPKAVPACGESGHEQSEWSKGVRLGGAFWLAQAPPQKLSPFTGKVTVSVSERSKGVRLKYGRSQTGCASNTEAVELGTTYKARERSFTSALSLRRPCIRLPCLCAARWVRRREARS